MNEKINTGAVRVLRDYTGRGPTKARSVIDHDSVTIFWATRLHRASAASPRAAGRSTS